MAGFWLLGLLGIGAIAGLFDVLNDDAPSTPPTPGNPDDDQITIETDGGTVNASAGNDDVTGSAGTDLISGEAGNDTLDGEAGNDAVFGGAGADVVRGNDGDDVLSGGAGADLLRGGSGEDILAGGQGADTLNGGLQDDILIGTATKLGDMTAEAFTTRASANSGTVLDQFFLPEPGTEDTDTGDVLNGAFGNDLLILGSADSGTGGEGEDVFTLGDWITAGSPATITDFNPAEDSIVFAFDRADGLPDNLTVARNAAGDAVISVDGQPVATVTGAGRSLTEGDIALISRSTDTNAGALVQGTNKADDLSFEGTDDQVILRGGADTADLGAGNDTAQGDTGNDTLLGGAGNDSLRGGADKDVLIDGDGADTLFGNLGDDLLIGSGYGGLPTEAGAPIDVSRLDYSADSDGTGDSLNGGYGQDQLVFGTEDTVTGGAGADRFLTSDVARGAVITDFNLSEDQLVISAETGAGPLEVSYSNGATATTGDALVSRGGQVIITLQGVGTSFTASSITLQARATS